MVRTMVKSTRNAVVPPLPRACSVKQNVASRYQQIDVDTAISAARSPRPRVSETPEVSCGALSRLRRSGKKRPGRARMVGHVGRLDDDLGAAAPVRAIGADLCAIGGAGRSDVREGNVLTIDRPRLKPLVDGAQQVIAPEKGSKAIDVAAPRAVLWEFGK